MSSDKINKMDLRMKAFDKAVRYLLNLPEEIYEITHESILHGFIQAVIKTEVEETERSTLSGTGAMIDTAFTIMARWNISEDEMIKYLRKRK